jgi:site-specific DNA-methyltransferase (adenine-specific)
MDNTLYFGDNLDILREFVADESVDLIYLDPPFNSQAQYNVLFDRPEDADPSAQAGAFRDMWMWGHEAEWAYTEVMKIGGPTARYLDAFRSALGECQLMAYLAMMTIRLYELKLKLKPTGCIYLHCDPTASHYLKIIMDGILGNKYFKNEVIWQRTSAHSGARRYGPVHDVILFYAATQNFKWNVIYGPYNQEYIDAFFTHEDDKGRRWRRTDLTGPGTRKGDSGLPWRDYNPTERNRHWQPPSYFYEKYTALTGDDLAQHPLIERLERLDATGLIHWPKKAGGMPQGKRLLEDAPGIPLQDIWTDIKPIHSVSSERVGYPTQKPVALLDRILRASSDEGDTVLDPFCGCGTTIEAAARAGRRWIGIDVAVHAIKVIESRLIDRFDRPVEFRLEGMPRDFASACRLAERDKYQFQWWANYLFNPHALKEQKKGGDRGVDGELFFPNGPNRAWGRMLTSVKGGAAVNPGMVRDFGYVLEREGAEMGLFICLNPPTRGMIAEAAAAGYADVVHGRIPRLQIVSIKDWFDGWRPTLPPMEHLPSAALARPNQRRTAKSPRIDKTQPELPLSFTGGKGTQEVIRHINPNMVKESVEAAKRKSGRAATA